MQVLIAKFLFPHYKLKFFRVNAVIRKINDKLQTLCHEYNFHYISNNQISKELLCEDRVHLSEKGVDIFASNFVNNVNKTILIMKT